MFENLSQLVGATGMVTSGSFRRRQIACHNGRNSGRPTRARQAASEEAVSYTHLTLPTKA